MNKAWVPSALWVGLALVVTLLAIRFRVAISEIIVGTVAQLIIGAFAGTGRLLASTQRGHIAGRHSF